MEKPPLPSTPADIPPSDIRRHPLSSDELRDVLSLIGTANAKGRPLAGRRVMVPATSKAFFEGTLRPAAGAASGERLVVNAGDGKLAEMARAEAHEFFDRRLDGLVAKSKGKRPKKSSATPEGKMSSKVGSASRSTEKATTPAAPPREASADPGAFPLIEIRETCDAGGNVIESEVVNMSNTMQRLGDGLKDVTGAAGDGGEGDGRQFGELLARTLKQGECDITRDVHKMPSAAEADDEEEKGGMTTTARREESGGPVNDGKYEALRSRLDELERLEEEDARSRREDARGARRLGGGGWSRGFLNGAGKKKNAAKATKRASAERNSSKTAGQPSGKVPTASSSDGAATATRESEPSGGTPAEKKNSRVSFSGENKIREIPRIGLTKVPPRPATPARIPAGPVRTTTDNAREIRGTADPFSPFSPTSAVPFEENVFRGVVKERPSGSASGANAGGEGAGAPAPGDGGGAGGKKKLSRFAQRRLERG